MAQHIRGARVGVLTCALLVAFAPSLPANVANYPEAEIVDSGPPAKLPQGFEAALSHLSKYLRDVSADTETLQAAENFLNFIESNPETFDRDVEALTSEELDAYAEGVSQGVQALSALSDISNRLANQDWLKEVDPELAQDIRRECARRFVGARDMYRAAEILLRDPADFEGDPVSLRDDMNASLTECIENLRVHAKVAAQELIKLDERIQELEEKLDKAKERGDQEAAKIIESEIEAAKQRREEVQSGIDLAQLGQFLIGVGKFVSGLVGVVASGGTCAPCYVEIIAGAGTAADAWHEINDTETKITQAPARRPGINPNGTPSDDDRANETQNIKANPNLSYIEPDEPGGNFLIAKESGSGNLIILQITPKQKITIDVSKVKHTSLSESNLLATQTIADVNWANVVAGELRVRAGAVTFILDGHYGGQAIRALFVQNPVTKPFKITVEPR